MPYIVSLFRSDRGPEPGDGEPSPQIADSLAEARALAALWCGRERIGEVAFAAGEFELGGGWVLEVWPYDESRAADIEPFLNIRSFLNNRGTGPN